MPPVSTPIIIDVEASGFGPHSYPIEVGVALETGSTFCSLIIPAPHWTHWDEAAENVHRVPRWMLQAHGRPMQDVAATLNRLINGRVLYTDGWVVDKPWLTTLFHEARTPMNFWVSPLEAILKEEQMERWHETKEQVLAESDRRRHRASFDAWVIQQTYLRTAV